MEWLLFIVIAGIIAAAVIYRLNRTRELMESGRIIKRPSSFWERKEIFYTKANFDTILAGTKSADFAESNTSFQLSSSSHAITFRNGSAWRARLEYDGVYDGEHRYTFSFTSWKQRKGSPLRTDTMNMAETSLEKVFLRADAKTMVEMRRGQFTTKTSFI